MKTFGSLLALALALAASPAHAEKLEFDYRLYAPLREVLDAGDKDMVDFDSANPKRLVDLIAVKGTSARRWTEALQIVSIVRPNGIADAPAWFEQVRSDTVARCAGATFTVLAQDAVSVTYERRTPGCASEPAGLALVRLVAGKRSWFQLSVLEKAELDPQAREQWLALLASAHLG